MPDLRENGTLADAQLPYPKAVERFPFIRQSILSDFDNCALTSAFSLTYERGWSSEPAARGTLVHRCVAESLRRLVTHEDEWADRIPVDVVVDDVLPQIIRQADVPMRSEDGLGGDVLNLPLRTIAQARVSLKAWAAHARFTVPNIAGIERRLTTTVHYPDEHGQAVPRPITGQIDLLLIDGVEATVVDWKDTFAVPPESSISEEGFFQQRDYALHVFHKYPRVQRVTLREVYLRYMAGKSRDRRGRRINPVREATIDRYNLPELEQEFSALVERFDRAVETGVYTATPGSHCSYCVRPQDCPIFPKARVEGRITSKDEAQRVAAELNVAEAAADQARKALRPWVRAHGDVDVRDAKRPRVFGPVVRTRTIKPSTDALRAGLSAGKTLDELYVTEDYETIGMHSPEERHPFVEEVALEEAMLLAAEKREGRS
jgi:hypothetical protein